MDSSSNDYHISFFKPTTQQAKTNRNMVIWLVSVWFIAIFGFHILLKIIEKPTPEPAYVTFQSTWSNIESGSSSLEDYQELGKSTLSVLGKIFVDSTEKIVLHNAFNWSLYQLTEDSLKSGLISSIQEFNTVKDQTENLSDEAYQNAKTQITAELSPKLALSDKDVRATILPLELSVLNIDNLTEETKKALPVIMEKYLVHSQSFLTDMKIFGFPFHYFYTAIFLLVLFVGLCWIYCVRTDKMNAELNIVD
jgi:putative solute:sodium symporter small subunit